MLTMVSAQNAQEGTLLLPLEDSSGGYIVKEIQGLDPVKATLISTEFSQIDGAQLHNKRRGTRNIVMKLGLEADYFTTSVADLRAGLYDYFMPKESVIFSLYSDGSLWGKTEAIVETCDNNMFSADPEVDISLLCYDPDFYAPDSTSISGATVNSATTMEIDYQGTTETGIIFRITFPGSATGISLHNSRPDLVSNVIEISGSFQANDILEINSNSLSKAITLTRSGLSTSVLSYLGTSSSWISLKKGINLFRAYLAGSPVSYTLEYTAKYGGF